MRWCLLLALAACTVGATSAPPKTPTAAPADTMPDEVLDKHDAGREHDRSHHGGSPGWFSGGNVCGSTCNPCEDVTRPDPGPGCLNQLACSGSGPSADLWFLGLAILLVARRRRSTRARRTRSC